MIAEQPEQPENMKELFTTKLGQLVDEFDETDGISVGDMVAAMELEKFNLLYEMRQCCIADVAREIKEQSGE